MRIQKNKGYKRRYGGPNRTTNTIPKNYMQSNAIVSIPRLPKATWRSSIVPITCTVQRQGATSSNAGVVATSYSFALADCLDVTNYTNIFDQYMIYRIDARVVMNPALSLPTTGTYSAQPDLISVIDYDDANVLTSVAQGLNFKNAMIHSSGSQVIRKFRPKCSSAVVNSAGTVVYGGGADALWINCAQTGIQHYGFKTIFGQGLPNSQLVTFNMYCKYHILFRNTR